MASLYSHKSAISFVGRNARAEDTNRLCLCAFFALFSFIFSLTENGHLPITIFVFLLLGVKQ